MVGERGIKMLNQPIEANQRRSLNSAVKNSNISRIQSVFSSPIGNLLIEVDDVGLSSLQLTKKKITSSSSPENPLLNRAKSQVLEFFNGDRRVFDLPLSLSGTEFQVKVWRELLKIPFGETKCYGDIAKSIGKPKASRAIGGAANKNPVMILIPCHRVIGKSGSMTGFACGIGVKKQLLRLEGHSL